MYPRDAVGDRLKLQRAGVAAVFEPATLYPHGRLVELFLGLFLFRRGEHAQNMRRLPPHTQKHARPLHTLPFSSRRRRQQRRRARERPPRLARDVGDGRAPAAPAVRRQPPALFPRRRDGEAGRERVCVLRGAWLPVRGGGVGACVNHQRTTPLPPARKPTTCTPQK
jgi:hypothetical protein